MLPPAVWVTVSQRTELLPIVILTDGFRKSNHCCGGFSIEKNYQTGKLAALSNDLAEIISNPGFIGCMAPDTSGLEMLVD